MAGFMDIGAFQKDKGDIGAFQKEPIVAGGWTGIALGVTNPKAILGVLVENIKNFLGIE